MTGYLTIIRGFHFLIVGFQLPPSGNLSTLRLSVPSGLSDDEHACSDAEDEIIHACVRLLSDSNPTSNDDSYKNKLRTDKN